MGLDLKAFSKLEYAEDQNEQGKYDVIVEPDSFNYILRRMGNYICNGETYSMRAGSYSSYNKIRGCISQAILGEDMIEGISDHGGHPIRFLVYFSDCDGILDAPFCKGIANELEEYKLQIALELMKRMLWDFQACIEYLDDMIELFKVGADDGVVIFC
jgi:hypothetical protein